MMTGFYDPTSGSILFDKIPLKNIDKISLRSQIGMYLEDMTIIKGTVYENIILGRMKPPQNRFWKLPKK
jgi:ABC-type bacteriocin/lantibiotic exporter with double-glycine peptidase domain